MKLIEYGKLVLSLSVLSCFLHGCVSADTVLFDSTSRPPTSVSEVKVLMEKPEQPYQVIARIQIGPDAFMSDYKSQTEELVKRAAALGANAVIVTYETAVTGYVGGNITTGVYGGSAESKFTVGQAIFYERE